MTPDMSGSDAVLAGKTAAIVVFSFYPSDVRVLRGAEAMSKAGMSVDLFCLQKSAKEPAREYINGVNVRRVSVKKRRGGKLAYAKQYLTFLLLSFLWLSRRQLIRRYDVVHVHNMPDFLVFCALLPKLLGSRVVLDLHDPTPEVFISVYDLSPDDLLVGLLRVAEKLSIGFADLVLTPNIAFQKLFISRSGPEQKIQIIMNSPLEEVFPFRTPVAQIRHGRDEDARFVVMFHGTLVERHGLHIAIGAVAQLQESMPGLRFHIYGAETAYLNQNVFPLVDKLGLRYRVQFFGEQPQDVIARAVSQCNLGVVPNLRTVFTEINLPTRIFEYLALGKPVIVPETQGIRDYFSRDNMLFFEGGNVEDLASKIKWVFDHPEETRSFVLRGQEIYRQHVWKQEHRQFIKLISELLA
jgi:glycosyltransferase involved in cell wall biosynthesis